jgi:amino acid transporter
MLGYSRVPYAAAREGYFFQIFTKVHPTKHIPHVSVLVLGSVTVACTLLKLEDVIAATMTTRILVQFVAQVLALPLLRRRLPSRQRPYRMWLYPIPALIALIGWLYIFATSGLRAIVWGVATLGVGVIIYLWHARVTATWPFVRAEFATVKSGAT